MVYTLEAALYNFLTNTSYEAAVLKAINFGDDTDTNAAVTGGLAGIHYGHDTIPEKWLNQLARKEDIERLADYF